MAVLLELWVYQVWVKRSNRLAVRCYSFDETLCLSRYDDGQWPWREAVPHISRVAIVLCVVCAYDDRLVWSSNNGYSSDWILPPTGIPSVHIHRRCLGSRLEH